MRSVKTGETTVNKTATESDNDTRLTRRRSRDVLVERVARAIWIQSGFGPDGFSPDEFYHRPYMDKARAAIEAMREPTGEMLFSAEKHVGWAVPIKSMWQAMIDAALSQSKD